MPEFERLPWNRLAYFLWPEARQRLAEGDDGLGAEGFADAGDVVGNVTEWFGLLSTFFAIAGAGIEPTTRAIQYAMNDRSPNAVPSPAQLTVMELREVFRDGSDGGPNIRAELLREPPSPVFKAALRAQGFDEYWADSIWASHWALPSIQQGFEMFHRLSRLPESDPRHFGLEQLRQLLKQQDVLAYYRPRLEAIAYAPLTRVDVRRMFNLGVLLKPDVVEAYMQLGYSKENAELLADFTENDLAESEAGELRSLYANAYKRGMIGRDAYREVLKRTGLPETAIDLALGVVDAEIATLAQREADAEARAYQRVARRVARDSRKGTLDVDLVTDELLDLGATPQDAATFIARNSLRPRDKQKDLTRSDITSAFKLGVMTETEAREGLAAQGLDTREVETIVATARASMKKGVKKERELTKTEVLQLLKKELMNASEAEQRLVAIGYATNDALRLIEATIPSES